MRPRYDRLVRLYEQKGHQDAETIIREGFRAKEWTPHDFELAMLFEQCYGTDIFRACRDGRMYVADVLREAQGATSTAAFTSITLQIVSQVAMDKYQLVDFAFSKLIPVQQTNTLIGERLPGYSEIGDEASVVPEGEPYPLVGVREDYVETPPLKKRGFIAPVTREAIFQNNANGRLLEMVGNGAYWLGVNLEKRCIDCFIDENTTDHRYKWRGNVINTYGDNSGNHTWDNLAAGNAFVDWNNANTVEQLFYNMRDPNTGEPVSVTPTTIIAVPSLKMSILRFLSSSELRVTTPGYATSGTPSQTLQNNPYLNRWNFVSSVWLADRLATDTDWFVGDPPRYAKRMVAWDIETRQAPPNSQEEFNRDVALQYRVGMCDALTVVNPRAMAKSTAA
jgi:hypothetical protein